MFYLDDYGHSKKYKDCLFFLFHLKDTKEFDQFQFKLGDFTSFYDFYDVRTPTNTMRMYVFKVHDLYRMDLFSFKHGRFDELTNYFKSISDPEIDFCKLKLDITQEIYRFNHQLETIKEDI